MYKTELTGMINMNTKDKQPDESEWSSFFTNYTKLKIIQEKQKMRGLNDYNLFTSLLDASDEVRLHTRFIYSLLNPEGSHYQGNLFLRKFISASGIENFGLDTANTKVFKEYKFIDLYITDGNKHIIIENKIYAGDQEGQISNYISKIQREEKIKPEDVFERIYVLYLTLDRVMPSDASLADYTITDNILQNKVSKVGFKSIHYKNEIMAWLNDSQKEVANLTNLNQVIEQYKEVVLLINNAFEGKIMSLKEFLGKDINNWKIVDEVGKQRDALLYDLFKGLSEKIYIHIKSEIKNNDMLSNVDALRRDSDTFLYSGGIMYINIYLTNNINIQLKYDSFFNIKAITVRFDQNELRKEQKEEVDAYSFSLPNDKNLYELSFNEENLEHLLDMHDQEFMATIDTIIDKYK